MGRWSKPGQKDRDCLVCGASFLSHGPGNRRCPRCARLLADGHMPRFVITTVRRMGSDAFLPDVSERGQFIRSHGDESIIQREMER